MTRIDKPEKSKVAIYRATLHSLATAPEGRHDQLEGKAAKLGLEIQGEESKAAPHPTPKKNRK